MSKEKVVLAYSGGLDTSVILDWLLKKDYDVTAYMADLGQEADFEAAEKKALKIGASDVVIADVKKEFVEDFIFPAIRANAKYEGRYLLGTSLARPLTARKQVEVAKEMGANILSHGATGKGNDQVRFELAYLQLMPGVEILAPWKKEEFRNLVKGRNGMIDYAKAHGIPIDQSKKDPWSSDDNMLHISYEAGMLEKPKSIYFERMFQLTVSPEAAPNKETMLEIEFKKGNPVRVRKIENYDHNLEDGLPENIKYGEEHTDPVEIIQYLNKVAGENGVGRVDMAESRLVGMKSRGVYETPAGTVLHFAHQDLEGIMLDREVIKINQHTSIDLATCMYNGFWFAPEREKMQNDIDFSQKDVNGTVRVGLYKGNVRERGRFSPTSLYDEGIASMDKDKKEEYDQGDAEGFIKILAVRPNASANRHNRDENE